MRLKWTMDKNPPPKAVRWLCRHIDRLVIASIAFLIIGAWLLNVSNSNKALVTLGAATLGAGLTMLITDLTSRRAIYEQHAKDANLRRRDEVYGPLHAELLATLKVFEQAMRKAAPYPRFVVISPAETHPLNAFPIPDYPSLAYWTTYQSDYRRNDFTPNAQHTLNALVAAAMDYDEAIKAASQPTTMIFARYIDIAKQQTESSADFDTWRANYAASHETLNFVKTSENGWYVRLLQPPFGSPYGEGLAQAWVGQSHLQGWILAEAQEKAIDALHRFFQSGGDPIPPRDWLAGIVTAAWPEVMVDSTISDAKAAASILSQRLIETEHMLKAGLTEIQDRFEGGPPVI